jgi:hypothetical protein
VDIAAIENLRSKIWRHLGGDRIHLIVEERTAPVSSDVNTALDAFVTGIGFHALRSNWCEVSRESAKTILIWLLAHEQVYGTRLLRDEQAVMFAKSFVGLFQPKSRFFTNYHAPDGNVVPQEGHGLHEVALLTKATFNSGIAAVDSRHVGLLWFEDED